MGYSRKYPPPLLWMTLNWVHKNFRISKNDSSRFCRILNLADSKYWGIPEFCKTFKNDFHGIPVKIHKILRKFIDFQSSLLSIFYRISNVVHGAYVDIFWSSPIQHEFFGQNRSGTEPFLANIICLLLSYVGVKYLTR